MRLARTRSPCAAPSPRPSRCVLADERRRASAGACAPPAGPSAGGRGRRGGLVGRVEQPSPCPQYAMPSTLCGLADGAAGRDRRGPGAARSASTRSTRRATSARARSGCAATSRTPGSSVELDGAEPERPNLVARLPGRARRAGARLPVSHVDTVLADAEDWRRDPWSRRGPRRLPLGPRRDRHEVADGRRGGRGRRRSRARAGGPRAAS